MGWDVISKLNSRTSLCLSQTRNWISNIICRVLFVFNETSWEVIVRFVDIGVIVDHKCLKFLFMLNIDSIITWSMNACFQLTSCFVLIWFCVKLVNMFCVYKC
jgi:hypothetical protein